VFLPSSRLPRAPLFPYTTLFRSAVVASDDQGDHQDGHDETQAGAGKGAQDDESAADASGNLDGLGVLAHGGLALGNRVVSVGARSEEHTSELQSRFDLVCRLLLE